MTCVLCDLPCHHAVLVLDPDDPGLDYLVCRACVAWLTARQQFTPAIVSELGNLLMVRRQIFDTPQ